MCNISLKVHKKEFESWSDSQREKSKTKSGTKKWEI